MEVKRNTYLDNAKFFLIYMVILSHAFRLGEGEFGRSVTYFYHFFHMPLIIFISGYFSRKMESKRFKKNIMALFEPLVIFDVLMSMVLFSTGDLKLSYELLVIPRWTLWYLVSLIFWRILTQLFANYSPKVIICASIIIGIVSGFVPIGRFLSFQRTCSLLPFFAAGFCMRKLNNDLSFVSSIPWPVAVLFLISLFASTFFLDFPYYPYLEGKTPYVELGFPLWQSSLIRLCMYFVCALASICVLRLIPKREIIWVSRQGRDTMLYYLYHTFVIYGLMFINNHVIRLPHSYIAVIFYSVIIVFVIWTLLKIPFFRILPTLISHFVNLNKERK